MVPDDEAGTDRYHHGTSNQSSTIGIRCDTKPTYIQESEVLQLYINSKGPEAAEVVKSVVDNCDFRCPKKRNS